VKRYLSLLIPVLLFFLGSCSSSKKVMTSPLSTAPLNLPDSLPTLPVSEIDLPLKIAGRPLLALADSLVPKEFNSAGWPAYQQPTCDFRYKYRFVRSAFTISCSNNKLGLQFMGSYQVAGSKCLCAMDKPVSPWISGTCGFGSEPMRRVAINISSQLSFSTDYRIHTFTRTDRLVAMDKCIVSMFSSDMTQQVVDSVNASIAAFCYSVDQAIARLNFSSYLQQASAKAWQKIPMGRYGYLAINPLKVRIGELNYARDTLTVSVGLSCRPELLSDSNRKGTIPPLPPLNSYGHGDGLSLYLRAAYDFSFISKILNDTLRGRSFVVKGNNVIIDDISVKGIGNHQIELRIDFSGGRKGRVYLRGTPVLDTAKQSLDIPDISYSLESKDLMLKIARSLLRNKIRKSLQGNSYLDIAALLKANLPMLNATLNRQLAPTVYSSGKIMGIKLLGLVTGEKAIQMQLYIHANLAVTNTGFAAMK
jgi:uncharacterized protein DUF4403